MKLQSKVEQLALDSSKRRFQYSPTEKIGILEVDNFPALGRLTALRFLEWIGENPDGVVSLPTGKTPEHFIKWVVYYLQNWNDAQVAAELEAGGLDPAKKPSTKNLRFVQIDEFYPINSTQSNSFSYYIKKYYIEGFGLDIKKALLLDAWNTGIPTGMTMKEIFPDEVVDLGLRTRLGRNSQERLQKEVIQNIDQYCTEYEDKIRKMGGIGFFLGGIGPDGHIGFNVLGSDHYSTTRLTATNYETQAAAASDLGGIEVARKRLVITVGLSTIIYNPEAVAIIIAAGEAKARVVREAVQEEACNVYPATVLQSLKNSRFYLTRGAASQLDERNYADLCKGKVTQEQIGKIVTGLALEKNKRLLELDKQDFESNRFAAHLLEKRDLAVKNLKEQTHTDLTQKIDRGLEMLENQVFLHTAPHHDDIMLGYWAYILHLVRTPLNQHHFTYMTSGFNAVTNSFVLDRINMLLSYMDTPICEHLMSENYFDNDNYTARNRDVYKYLDGVAAHSRTMQNEGEARRMLRNLIFLFEEPGIKQLKNRISELQMYFESQYPGKKDLPYIQQFKGMIREWEADLLWGYLGFNNNNVHHMRLGFYKGDIFTEEPTVDRDVAPVLRQMMKIQPSIVTVALDPEASGPDTHYKVLQVIAESLKEYIAKTGRKDVKVWGYRNVWYRFHPTDVNILVPVSLNSMAVLENAFDKCFGSQRNASFPSYELDGPFSRLARKIMVEQYLDIKTCLGREFFYENQHPRIRASHGMVYIKEMLPDEFLKLSREMRKTTENIDDKKDQSES